MDDLAKRVPGYFEPVPESHNRFADCGKTRVGSFFKLRVLEIQSTGTNE
jgi:hypothetical protein